MKKQFFAVILACILAFSAVAVTPFPQVKAAGTSSELRGIWISIFDFASLGIKDKKKAAFKSAVDDYLDIAEDYGINAVFLQVRAYDDAFWPSKTFPAMTYLNSKANATKKASKVYTFDPLDAFIDVAEDHDMEVHAWLNPYRINTTQYLDPALTASQTRVKKAVKELLDYDLDGIHFDDYFYHATGGYVSPSKRTKAYQVNITPAKKRSHVNKLIRAVYKLAHNEDMVFGISPQGNYTNDMNSGADVKTWLSSSGYVDYLAPQLYWTNNYGSGQTMYSNCLNQFLSLRKNSAKLYVGLALYKGGTNVAGDPGWSTSSYNLRDQVKLMRDAGGSGFILFSARFLKESAAKAERNHLCDYLGL